VTRDVASIDQIARRDDVRDVTQTPTIARYAAKIRLLRVEPRVGSRTKTRR
jgi:hypothetical protein